MAQLKTFLLQHYAKLQDLYLSMTLGNRIVSALLAVILFVSLGHLIVGGVQKADTRTQTVYVFNGYMFDRVQARAADSALASAGLRGHHWVGDRLQVPRDREHLFLAVLAAADVTVQSTTPRQDTADSLNPWHNAKIMDQKMNAASEKTLVAAIKTLPGIAEVTVISHKRPVWERNIWARTQQFSVSVTLEAIDNKPLPLETITAIGNIVAPAFGIVDMKEIRIVDARNNRSYDGIGEELGGSQGTYQRHQARYQDEWNRRLYEHLPNIEGLSIESTVRLTQYRTEEYFDVQHGKPTVLTEHQMGYEFDREGYNRFFRPGQVAQWGSPLIDPTGNVSPTDVTRERRGESEITNALQGRETKTTALPFIPQQVTISIRVPQDYIITILRERNRQLGLDSNVMPSGEEIEAEKQRFAQDTRQDVAKLIESYRVSNRQDPMDLVNIVFYTRVLPQEIELTAWEQFLLFLQQNWQTLSLMSLVFSGLAVLWFISKPQKPEPIVIYEGLETPIEAIDARLEEKRRLEEEARRLAEMQEEEEREFENSLGELGDLRSLRDEIAELIAKNPEAAAAVIRQWIGNAVLVEAKT